MGREFKDRIRAMNEMYNLPVNDFPVMENNRTLAAIRLGNFMATLEDEVHEIKDIIISIERGAEQIDVLTALADLLGDVVVYCRSEALKYGVPLEPVLQIIMDSNESKLDRNGQPIYDEKGKFLKGPNYWKPEPKIKELLQMEMMHRSNLEEKFK